MARPPLLHQALTDRILGVFFQVHHELGIGFAESVYSPAMGCALKDAGLAVEREVPIAVHFRGIRIGSFRADIIVDGTVLLELKAMRRPDPLWNAQLLNYLRATKLELGLLLYFNPEPTFKRLIYTNDHKVLPRTAGGPFGFEPCAGPHSAPSLQQETEARNLETT